MDQLHNSVQNESEIGAFWLGIVLYSSSNKATSLFVFHPICYPCISLALPPSRITQIRGRIAGSPPPFPLLHTSNFHRENPAFSSLLDSRRIVPTHAARRSQQSVDPFFALLQIKSNLTTVGTEFKDQR